MTLDISNKHSICLNLFQVADFGGKMILQSTLCLIAKSGTELEFMAFFKPLKPVSVEHVQVNIMLFKSRDRHHFNKQQFFRQ